MFLSEARSAEYEVENKNNASMIQKRKKNQKEEK